jgi:basic membrane protein A
MEEHSMKKYIALLLALVMVFALTACGQKTTEAQGSADAAVSDEMTSDDGSYEVAFVTDVGQLKDKSFNEGTWDGVKRYADENALTYKYYQPANGSEATDDDRYDAFKAAADNGAKVIVAAGFMQGTAIEKAAKEYPDVKFVFIDGWAIDGCDNVAGIAFQEEQCGYLAGYAAVMEGYTKLGFCGGGGGENPAVNRYGYGYVQGAEAAAAEKDVKVDMNYTFQYGASFSPSAELQALAAGWYEQGTEVIFSCGGSIFDSITAAASANDAKVIGVDTDQSFSSPTVITSALKGIGEAAYQALEAAYGDNWAEWGGQNVVLGAAEDAVGLPVDTWSLQNWTVEQYKEMMAKIVSGELEIDSDYENLDSTEHVALNIVE